MDIGIGRTEAESLDRRAFAVFSREGLSGGRGIEAFLTGNAWGDFEGADGVYDITIHYLDENDGDGAYALLLNDTVIHEWVGDGGGSGIGTPETETVTVNLRTDDVIGIRSTKIDGEFGRIDFIEVTPSNGTGTGIGTGPGTGDGPLATIGTGLSEAEFLTISGDYTTETNGAAGNGRVVGTDTSGSVSGAFSGAAGLYDITINYLDESDGVGSYQLLVNGVTEGSWQGTGGTLETGSPASETFEVELDAGDVIEVVGVSGGDERARLDSLLIAQADGNGGSSGGEGRFIVGRTEAEDLALNGGYTVQSIAGTSGGQVIGTLTNGSGSGTFDGPGGDYDLTVNYLDESDGVATFRLLVNGVVVDSWLGTGGGNTTGTAATRALTVSLAAGDTIALEGVRSDGEAARFDSVDIEASRGGGAGGTGGSSIAVGLNEIEDLTLAGAFDVEARAGASGGSVVRSLTGTYTASGSFAGAAGRYEIDVNWLNENDGVSAFELLVNGQSEASWTGAGGSAAFSPSTETIAVDLNPNDTITINASKGGEELARVDSLVVRAIDVAQNTPPVVSNPIADSRATAGSAFSLAVPASTFEDADGDTLSLTAGLSAGAVLPGWLAFDPATGVFSGVPQGGDVGSYAIELSASDGAGSVSDTFLITVGDDGSGGTLSAIGVGVTEAETLTLQGYEIEDRGDASGGQLVRTFANGLASGEFVGPSGSYFVEVNFFNESDGVATWIIQVNGAPVAAFAGVGGSNGFGTPDSRLFEIALEQGDILSVHGIQVDGELARLDKLTIVSAEGANASPIVDNAIDDTNAIVGSPFVFVVPATTFSDPDGDALTLSATVVGGLPLPDWLSFDANTGTFSGTPGTGDIDVLRLVVNANDGEASAADIFEIAVSTPPSATALLAAGANEVEDLDLDGYEIETRSDAFGGEAVRTFASGTASGAFVGQSGLYEVRVDFLDENDGVAEWSVLVNGAQQASFLGTGGDSGIGTADFETFTIVLQDGDVVSLAGTRGGNELARLDRITLTSLEVNAFPIAGDDSATGLEDTALIVDVLANDTDEEGDALSVIAVQGQSIAVGQSVGVAGGTVTLNPDGTLTVLPPDDFVGDFGFNYTVSDGAGFNVGTVTISFENTNDAPRVSNEIGTVSVNEDDPLSVSLVDVFSDIDVGDTLSLSATLDTGDPLPDWLTLDDTPGAEALFGTPTGDDVGTYEITLMIEDSAGETAESVVTVRVENVNDVPVAVDDETTGREDTVITLDVLANDEDEDGDALSIIAINGSSVIAGETVRIVSEVSVEGRLVTVEVDVSLNVDGTMTLTPPAEFAGPIAFSYTMTDGEFTDTATATVNVVAGNDAPTISAAIADQTASEDQAFEFAIPAGTFNDIDGDTLTLSAFQSNGQPLPQWLTFEGGVFSGTPTSADSAVLQILVLASDGQFVAGSIFSLDVVVVDDAPVATDDLVAAFNAGDGFSLTIGSEAFPVSSFGTDEDSVLTPDSVSFTGASLDGVPINDLAEIGLSYDPGTGLLQIASADAELFSSLSDAETGSLVVAFTVSDGASSTDGSINFAVTGVNDAPAAADDSGSTGEDASVSVDVLANDDDPDGAPLSITQINGVDAAIGADVSVGNGIVRIEADQTITVTPDENYVGPLVFTYTVSDGELTSEATATITVEPANDAPDPADDLFATPEDTAVTIDVLANDTDIDGDSLTITQIDGVDISVGAPVSVGGAQVALAGDGELMVTPGEDDTSPIAFDYTVTDGVDVASASAVVTVNAVNDAPIAKTFTVPSVASADEVVSLVLGTDFDVSDLATDVDSVLSASSFLIVGGASGISYDSSLGIVRFDPGTVEAFRALADGQSGVASAAVVVSDGLETSLGLIVFSVAGVNDAPETVGAIGDQTISAGVASVVADAPNVFVDVDAGDALSYTATDDAGDSLPSWLSVDSGTGILTATPGAGDLGTVTVVLTATDEANASVSETFDVTVEAAASPPIEDQQPSGTGSFSFDAITARAEPVQPFVDTGDGDGAAPDSAEPGGDGDAAAMAEFALEFDLDEGVHLH